MKKTDVALLAMIVVISLAVSYFVGQALLNSTQKGPVNVEAVSAISADIQPPDPDIFNPQAINPAVPIDIGKSTNELPFGQ